MSTRSTRGLARDPDHSSRGVSTLRTSIAGASAVGAPRRSSPRDPSSVSVSGRAPPATSRPSDPTYDGALAHRRRTAAASTSSRDVNFHSTSRAVADPRAGHRPRGDSSSSVRADDSSFASSSASSRVGSAFGSGANSTPGTPPSIRATRTKTKSAVGHGSALSPSDALEAHAACLTDYERSEITEYPLVWYAGAGAKKTKGTKEPGALNHGYDDERGDYAIAPRDHLAYRFEILEIWGKGSFGQVMRCFDHKTKSIKAVKVIRNKKRFHHQALVEVKILEHLRHKDPDNVSGVVHMHEYFYFRNHLCISFEPLSSNLYEFVKNNNFRGLSLSLIRRFAAQLLQSLKFLRSQRVIHCDLKPENILLRQPNKSAIKVIDFGSSCFEDERAYTYIQSRFYRSPEVILGTPYDEAIDMWSLGCILAELYTGYPLFPGENEAEQLACIMEALGTPPRSALDRASRRKHFFDSSGAPRATTNSRGKRRLPGTKNLAQMLKCADRGFVKFLERCLRWNPRDRHTPEEALAHEWIASAASAGAKSADAASAANASASAASSSSSRHHTPRAGAVAREHASGVVASTSKPRGAQTQTSSVPGGYSSATRTAGVGYASGAYGTSRTRAELTARSGRVGSNHGSGSSTGTGSGTGSSRGGREGGSGADRLALDGLRVSSTARLFSGMRVGSDGREETRVGGAVLPRLARRR